MKEPSIVPIGDHKYEFRNWEPELGLRMLTRLIKLVGEPAAKAIIGLKNEADKTGKGLDGEIPEGMDAMIGGEVIASLAKNLDEEDVIKFVRESMTEAFVDGKPLAGQYKAHFLGRPGLLLKVVKAQLQHQLSDFLELLPVGGLS